MRVPRAIATALAGGLLLAACSGGEDETAETDEATEVSTDAGDDSGASGADSDGDVASEAASGEPGVPVPDFDYSTIDYSAEPADRALDGNRVNPSFPPPVVDPGLIVSGGPPPDGIPPIDDPVYLPAADIDFLEDDEAVVLVEIDGDARAFPIQIMIWHEIVNDTIGDTPVTVTYCPLCNSALAYDRRLGDRVLDFGTSGELYQSALVMYDRQTGSLWAHFTGQGIVGHYAGADLDFIPAQTISWAQFKEAHPEGQVLTRNTGHDRQYGTNPYQGYDFAESDPIGGFFNGEIDRTLDPKARIVGINDDAGSVAVRFEDFADSPVVPVTEDGRNLVVFHAGGLASALQANQVAEGDDIGQTGVFVAESPADGSALTFTAEGDDFVDAETGTTWDVLGRGVAGPLEGERLAQVSHVDTFWFAWATYRSDTTIIEP